MEKQKKQKKGQTKEGKVEGKTKEEEEGKSKRSRRRRGRKDAEIGNNKRNRRRKKRKQLKNDVKTKTAKKGRTKTTAEEKI